VGVDALDDIRVAPTRVADAVCLRKGRDEEVPVVFDEQGAHQVGAVASPLREAVTESRPLLRTAERAIAVERRIPRQLVVQTAITRRGGKADARLVAAMRHPVGHDHGPAVADRRLRDVDHGDLLARSCERVPERRHRSVGARGVDERRAVGSESGVVVAAVAARHRRGRERRPRGVVAESVEGREGTAHTVALQMLQRRERAGRDPSLDERVVGGVEPDQQHFCPHPAPPRSVPS